MVAHADIRFGDEDGGPVAWGCRQHIEQSAGGFCVAHKFCNSEYSWRVRSAASWVLPRPKPLMIERKHHASALFSINVPLMLSGLFANWRCISVFLLPFSGISNKIGVSGIFLCDGLCNLPNYIEAYSFRYARQPYAQEGLE